MSEEDIILTISGAALSLLLFENAQCAASDGDQVGFVLGEVVDYLTKVVTDNEKDTHHRKRHINVHTVLAYPPITPFFDGHGQISEKMLHNFLREKKSSVIGWFRFKNYDLPGIGINSNHAPVLTYRENRLHQNLKKIFAQENGILSETFVLLYLSTSISGAGGTHTFKQLALLGEDNIGNNQYRPIPIRINNLGFDASRPSGSDYKLAPIKYINEKEFFTGFCEKAFQENANNPLKALETVQKKVGSFLGSIADSLSNADADNVDMRKRINDLRRRIFSKKQEKQQKEMEKSKPADEKMSFSDADSQDTLDMGDQELERQDSSPVLGKSNLKARKKQVIAESDDSQDSDADIQVVNEKIDRAKSQRTRPITSEVLKRSLSSKTNK